MNKIDVKQCCYITDSKNHFKDRNETLNESGFQIKIRLVFGIFILSWSSIIVRWIGDVDALIIAFYRLAVSALFLLPFALKEKGKAGEGWNKLLPLMLLAGFFLALHFYSWITSLQMTTVGNSIFLESTHPVFALILSVFFLKEKASLSLLPALVLGIAGMYITVFRDIQQNETALLGDALALFSAFCIAAYLLIARYLKKGLPILTYLCIVYGMASFFILGLLFWRGIVFWDLPEQVWMLLLLLALGPNLIGHSLLNWASRRMPVYLVNMALLSESVLAASYAALLLNEIPPPEFYFGALLIIISIVMVFRNKKKAKN